jgi:long-subunit fatty acid transport protein
MQLKLKFVTVFLFLVTIGLSQDSSMFRRHPPKERFLDKVYVGGNVGAQFGAVTVVELSPLVGYRITDKISAGVGFTYQYYHYKVPPYDLETNVFGGRVFGRYLFTDYLFGHVEYEYLNLEAFDYYPRRRVDVGSLLAGGGYIQRFNGNSGFFAMVLYNFTESVYTPYTNPIIRIGVLIGL